MSQIVSKTEYVINSSKGQFKLVTSRHDDGLCFAGVIYYTKKGSRAEDTDVSLELHMETVADFSESTVYKEAVTWIKSELDPKAHIAKL